MKDSYYILEDGVLASVSLFPPVDGLALVTGVEVSRRGRGQGRAQRVLELLLADADAEGIRLMLAVDPQEFDVDYNRLAEFYKRNGFEWLEEPTMYREPR